MEFLVIGCGSIGERHIKNLKSLSMTDIIACDIREERLRLMERKYSVETYNDVEKALDQPVSAVLVCTPTSTHIPIALSAANRGQHLFIEKPLSHSLDDLDKLIRTVRDKELVTLVGCNTRFFASMKFVKGLVDNNSIGKVLSTRASCGFYLPYWHPAEDYRKGYTANKLLGGGIILDDIHEIDYLRWLLGEIEEVFCLTDKISDLEMDTEDFATIILKFESGAIAEVHLDCIQQTYRRSCELIGEKGIIIWDYIRESVKVFNENEKRWKVFSNSLKTGKNDMFIAEMKHFIDCVEGKDISVNDVTEAKHVLEIALAAKESARTRRIVNVQKFRSRMRAS
jgi:predicted dehydrogenase